MAQPLSIEDTFFPRRTYTVKAFSRTTGFVKALLDGYEISGIIGAKQDRIRRSPLPEMQRLVIVALTVSEATVCSWTVNEDLMPGRIGAKFRAAPDGRRWNLRGRYACRTWSTVVGLFAAPANRTNREVQVAVAGGHLQRIQSR